MSFWLRDIPTGKVLAILTGVAALFLLSLSVEVAIAPVKSQLERKAVCEASLGYMRKLTRTEYTPSHIVNVPYQIRDADCLVSDATLTDKTTARYQGEASLDGNLSWATPYTVDLVKDGDTWRVTNVKYGDREHRQFHTLPFMISWTDFLVFCAAVVLPGMPWGVLIPFTFMIALFGYKFAICLSFGYYLLQWLIGGANAYD